jgi:hypothetical protein
MIQEPLFVESLEEALRDAVNALKGPKAVGVMLWPSMKADLAGRRVNQCLDPERDEKFDLSEILLIVKAARALNKHTVMAFLARELDYEFSPIDPETVETKERRELADLLNVVKGKLDRLEKRDRDRNPLRSAA